jgi:hypothetical protein
VTTIKDNKIPQLTAVMTNYVESNSVTCNVTSNSINKLTMMIFFGKLCQINLGKGNSKPSFAE